MIRIPRGRWAGVAVTLLAALAVACGGGDDSAPTTAAAPTTATTAAAADDHDEAAEIDVTLTEFAIALDGSSAHAGDVTFVVSNGGAAPHELAVIRTDLAPDALPTAAGLVDEGQVEVLGRTAQLGGGATEDVTFALSSGSYVLICNIPAHYDLGMRVAFTVD